MLNLKHCQGLGYLIGLNFCKTYYNVMMDEMAKVMEICLALNDTDIERQEVLVVSFLSAVKAFKQNLSKHHFKASLECNTPSLWYEDGQYRDLEKRCIVPSLERVDHSVCCAVEV